MSSMKFLLAAMLGAGLPVSAVSAQPAPPTSVRAEPPEAAIAVESGEGRAVALKLADDLLAKFVDHAAAEDYAAMLKKNAAAGRYDSGTRGELAKLMTDDLLAVHKDGHLHVMLAPPPPPAGAGGEERRGPPPNWPPLIQSAKTIAPGIGYIRFTAFLGTDEEMAGVR
jgi:hypothetical protein